MKRIIAVLMSLALLSAGLLPAALADDIETFTWKDEETGDTYVDEFNYVTRKVTTTKTAADGTVTVETYSMGDEAEESSGSETVKNSDGSITVVSKDQTDVTINVDNGTAAVASSGGLTQAEWEARMAKAVAANGSSTETVYRDVNGNIWPVRVEYVGLGRSSVVVNGDRCMVPTSSLSWVTEAPEDKLLAVVTTEKQSYVTLRAKKSQKAFVMGHCEKCQVVRVISTGKTWTMVDCDGMRGYVLTSGLTFYDNAPRVYTTGMVTFRGNTTSKNTVHVRSGTNGSAKQLQAFACGTPLTVFSQDGKWYEVDVGGWHAWIMNEYVTLEDGAIQAARETETP